MKIVEVDCKFGHRIIKSHKRIGDLKSHVEVRIYYGLGQQEDKKNYAYFFHTNKTFSREKWFQLLSAKDKEEYIWNMDLFLSLKELS